MNPEVAAGFDGLRLSVRGSGLKDHAREHGFSLVEMLVVLAIVGVLAALLLPVLSKGRDRAKQTACLSQLRQIGVGFHAFAHAHNNLFPMRVPADKGGSLESASAAMDQVLASRHFQTLSNELDVPRILVCPADTRLPARHFAALQNSNVSYFVGVVAEYGQPTSILAGDRNLTNDWLGPQHNYRVADNSIVRWTHELHRFRGNLLFADGHAESWKGATLLASAQGAVAAGTLTIPTTLPTGAPSPPPLMLGGAEPILTQRGSTTTRPSPPVQDNTSPAPGYPASTDAHSRASAEQVAPVGRKKQEQPRLSVAQLSSTQMTQGAAALPPEPVTTSNAPPTRSTNSPVVSGSVVTTPPRPPPTHGDSGLLDGIRKIVGSLAGWLYLLLLVLLLLAVLIGYLLRRRGCAAKPVKPLVTREKNPWYTPGEEGDEDKDFK